MTRPNFTSINVIIDESGSMSPLTNDTIGGFNTFLREQKAVPGDAVLTLAKFSDTYNLVYDCVPIKDVAELTPETYRPGGSTALLDALGRTIDTTGRKLASMKEEERPNKVIVLLITDGEENASKEYVHAKVMEKINHQRDKYSWQFVFLGAGQDAIRSGVSYGFAANQSYNYNATRRGTSNAYQYLSNSMTSNRIGATMDFVLDQTDLLDDNKPAPSSVIAPVVSSPIVSSPPVVILPIDNSTPTGGK